VDSSSKPAQAVREARIPNSEGLHARPCHAIVSVALGFGSDFRVAFDGREVNGKSILELMTLNAPCDSVLRLAAVGDDAEELVSRVAALIEAGFEGTH
jgi:phosphocarrier protein